MILCYALLSLLIGQISAVVLTGTNKEQLSGTAVTLSCVITDIIATATVVWSKTGEIDLASSVTGHTVVVGTFSSNGNTQTSTLAITGSENTVDTTFTCKVTPAGGAAGQITMTSNLLTISTTPRTVKSGTLVTLSCDIGGITAIAAVTWRKGGVYDVSDIPGYTVDQGTYSSSSQTSTLELTAEANTEDTVFTCDVVPAGGDGTVQSKTLALDVFALKGTNKEVLTDSAVTLSCVITDITASAVVVWSKSGTPNLGASSVSGYTVVQGTYGANKQTSTLAIDAIDADMTYTCQVTPTGGTAGQITMNGNIIGLKGSDKKVKKGTAVTLSCVVTDITASVTTTWRKADVTDLLDVPGYTVDQGTFSTNTQTSKLVLTGDVNTEDMVYTCDVVPAGGDGTPVSKTMDLKVYEMATGDKEVLTGTAVTLSCVITDITASVTVLWKKDGTPDLGASGVVGYTVVQGTYGANKQTSTLAIATAQNTADTTFTCVVTPSTGTAWEKTVQLNVFTMTGTAKNVMSGQATTLTCTVAAISEAPLEVRWKTSGKPDMYVEDGYTVTEGIFNEVTKTLVYKLAISDSANSADATFTCDVLPAMAEATIQSITVAVDVFTVQPQAKEVERGTAVTISCDVTDITSAVTTVWKNSAGSTLGAANSGYTVVQGTYGSNKQTSTLAMTTAKNTADVVYTCIVTPSGGTAGSTMVTLNVFDLTMEDQGAVKGTQTRLLCKVSDISQEVTASGWERVSSGVYEYEMPLETAVADKVFTCSLVVDGITYKQTADLDVFEITAQSRAVIIGKTATAVSCTLSGVTKTVASGDVKWYDESMRLIADDTAFTGGNKATYTYPSAPTNDMSFTCVFDIYNEKFYSSVKIDVMNMIVKDVARQDGTSTTLSCTIQYTQAVITSSMLKWRTGASSSADITTGVWLDPVYTLDAGKLSADATYTCMMQMDGEWFSKTTAVDMFAITDSQNTHVLKGYGLALTCDVHGLQATIDKTTDLMWTSRDTSYNAKAAWDTSNTKYTLTLAAGDVTQDMVFTCSVKIDGVWHTKTVDVDFFELSLTAPDTAVPDQTLFNMTCTTVGLNAVLDTANIKWMTSSGSSLSGAHLELPGLVVEMTATIATDKVTYVCGVNYAGTWQTNSIVIDVFEFNTRDYTKIIGTDISITCGASKLTTFAITEDRVKWVTKGNNHLAGEPIHNATFADSTLTNVVYGNVDQVFTCYLKPDTTWFKYEILVDVFDIELEYKQRSIVYGRVPKITNKCEVTGLRQTLLTTAVKWETPGEDPISTTSWTSPILTLTQELKDYTKDKIYTCSMVVDSIEYQKMFDFDIIESCKVTRDIIDSITMIDTTEDWVLNTTVVSITCKKGYLLDDAKSYSHTCVVTSPTIHETLTFDQCKGSCWMTNPADQLSNGEPSSETAYKDSSTLTTRNTLTTYDYQESYQLAGATYTTVHKSKVTEQNCGAGYTLRDSWAKTVTCPATASTGTTFPREVKLTNLCVIGCAVTQNAHTTYPGYTPTDKKASLLAQLDSIEYYCKDQRYTATGANEFTKTCLVGEAAALNECKEVDMEAPKIAPHQGTVKITFSKARHPTTDPSKYGISLYSKAGTRVQSQYTTIKQAVFEGLSNATFYQISYNMTFIGGVYINSSIRYNFTTEQAANTMRKTEHHETSLDVPKLYFTPTTYDIMVLYVSKGYIENYETALASGAKINYIYSWLERRRRDVRETLYNIYVYKTEKDMYDAQKDKMGAFIAKIIPAEDIGSASTYYIDTSTLGLDKDFEFHMFLRACKSNYTTCVDGKMLDVLVESHWVTIVLCVLLIPLGLLIIAFILWCCYAGKCPLTKRVYEVNDNGRGKSHKVSLPSLNENTVVVNRTATSSEL